MSSSSSIAGPSAHRDVHKRSQLNLQPGRVGTNGTDGANVNGVAEGVNGDDLWSEILGSARRQRAFGRKNVLVLSEKHHGRTYLVSQLKGLSGAEKESSSHPHVSSRRRRGGGDTAGPSGKYLNGKGGSGDVAGPGSGSGSGAGMGRTSALALGYEVMHIREDGDEESVPPVSIYYPPSSSDGRTGVVSAALPPTSLSDTIVMIVLDWSRPSRMMPELLAWLRWIDQWTGAAANGQKGTSEVDSGVGVMSMREKLQLHIQRYTEPPSSSSTFPSTSASAPTSNPTSTSTYNPSTSALLPLGPGTLTLNPLGIPIVVVCTKSDQMDAAGETTVGLKGNAWEERVDWGLQVLRTVCLAYGAALIHTSPSHPTSYTHLRTYLLHRLYSIPIPAPDDSALHTNSYTETDQSAHTAALANSRFPFLYRANVLDKEAVLVPTGWDSWGKIKVVREGYEPEGVLQGLEDSLARGMGKSGKGMGEEREEVMGKEEGSEGLEGLEGVWRGMMPELEGGETNPPNTLSTTVEPEQSFLSRHFETLAKDPLRDPRAAFRNPSSSSSHIPSTSTSQIPSGTSNNSGSGQGGADDAKGYGGVVGPMGASGLALPGVERAMAEMEGQGAEDLKEKFAKLGRKDGKGTGMGVSPVTPGTAGGASATGGEGKAVPNEALHNFFQGLLATKGKTGKTSAPPTPSTAGPDSKVTPPASAGADGGVQESSAS